jgi:isochorismate hydrolase
VRTALFLALDYEETGCQHTPIQPNRSALLLFDMVNAFVYPAATASGSPMDSAGLVQSAA